MDDDVLKRYRAAGRILADVISKASARIDVGVSLLEVADYVENSIRQLGGEPAFPCNISRDREAAHYTPKPNDDAVFGEEMVKLDIGVHVDGYIADAAVTVDLSGHPDLVDASRAALDAALELVAPGVSTCEIGRAIESAIEGYGFRPVSNLTGHGLTRFNAHTEPTVPNRSCASGVELRPGDVIAIEPFATNGSGRISDSPVVEIFGFTSRRPVRDRRARAMLAEIETRFNGLPFARRWLRGESVDYSLQRLIRAGAIHTYPVLWEIEGAMVSQAEHTVIVTESGCEIITR
ncbi:MAG: type II methionyl aminopeptidase [Methanothrix sp.]|nr:type II methionyl aminopeptidase [Methanothrix sp.]MCX8207016.1 type II methionyl aminopeptidase [Methanothrix sp.]